MSAAGTAWPGINPAELRHLVTIQSLSAEVDTVGQRTVWDDIASVRAKVSPKSGSEGLAGQAISAPGQFLITVRYSARWTVAPKDRISWGTRLFDISNVANKDERNILLEIEAVERL